jgi:hypothetical protein
MAWTKEARESASAAKKKKGSTNQYTKAKLEGRPIPESPNKGTVGQFKGRFHSEESKQKIKEKALASKHRRLKKNTIGYRGITLDSTWELILAKSLDEQNILWVRPDPIVWKDEENKEHHYFPDFFLPEYNLFIDPKNPYAYKVQKKKIDIIKKQLTNLIFLCSIEEINEFAFMVKQDITRVF